jgi:hypothetical protein
MRSSLSRAPHFLFAHEKKCARTEDADHEHDLVVANEVGIDHQSDAEQHRFPAIHSLPVDEGDETDRAKDKAADQICRAEVHDIDLLQLEMGQDRHRKVVVDHG